MGRGKEFFSSMEDPMRVSDSFSGRSRGVALQYFTQSSARRALRGKNGNRKKGNFMRTAKRLKRPNKRRVEKIRSAPLSRFDQKSNSVYSKFAMPPASLPLSRRPGSIIAALFFASHIPVTLLVDSQAGEFEGERATKRTKVVAFIVSLLLSTSTENNQKKTVLPREWYPSWCRSAFDWYLDTYRDPLVRFCSRKRDVFTTQKERYITQPLSTTTKKNR